ncbi:hypothetical protein [Streptomyces pseudogriseolus]|uniref:hypothetical protein n=1 Tax=Streptomyces pseudogriseolus TaxID=36817 RepID=UPI000A37C51C
MVISLDIPTVQAVAIMCGACGRLPRFLTSDGDFACADGHVITERDLVLETGEAWCVTPAGRLAYVTDPKHAVRVMSEAAAAMALPDGESEFADPHAAYAEASSALLAAAANGLRLPAGTEVAR